MSSCGRNARRRASPAQIRTCGTTAYGSYVACLASKRATTLPHTVQSNPREFPALYPARGFSDRVPLHRRPSLHWLRHDLAVVLFANFFGTTLPSDSSVETNRWCSACAFPTASAQAVSKPSRLRSEVSRFPRSECPHMPSSRTPPGRPTACIARQSASPSPPYHRLGSRIVVISEFHSSPVLSPVNASPRPRGSSRHDSEPVRFATPSP